MQSLHIVLRSSWAFGPNSFRAPRNLPVVQRLIRGIARKFQIKVYRQAIVGNHIHLMIGFIHRESYKSFVRLLSGQIASQVMGQQSFKVFRQSLEREHRGDTPASLPASRGRRAYQQARAEIQGKGQQFFQFRPFTRMINWGRDFQNCGRYLRQNVLEAMGFIPYQPRGRKIKSQTMRTVRNDSNDSNGGSEKNNTS